MFLIFKYKTKVGVKKRNLGQSERVIVVVQCQVRIVQLYRGENKIYIHVDEIMIDDVLVTM